MSSNPRRRSPGARSGTEPQNGLPLQIMTALRKGATFHSPTLPLEPRNDFAPPRLTRAQSDFDEFTNANCRRIALALNEIDEALAKTAETSLGEYDYKSTTSLQDTSLPAPRLLLDLPVIDPAAMEPSQQRRVLRPRSVRKSRAYASDSGIGSSIVSSTEKRAAVETAAKLSKPPASAATGAAASATAMLPTLGSRAAERIYEHVLRPLLAKDTLKDFKSIVLEMPRRIQSDDIRCLRDLEKSLCSMAPAKAETADLFLDFCLTSIRCIQATVEYIPDREQIRPGDRPYSNGYFIDLKDQLYNYAKQLAAVQEKGDVLHNDMDFDQSDEIRLHGGIAENGRPAELVRVKKDGTAISMATGKVVDLNESPAQLKRSLSEQREDEEEIMRSMARRKKNASPEELALKRCREPNCTKEFKRPCDLTKHEKTHSRPWKCPFSTCKYHDYGWPTEKEMDRHINDKHSDAPAMYECLFKPCPYKSKRESNCKQHMEKAHGWVYVRTKTNGKKQSSNPADSIQQTPLLGNLSIPSATPSSGVPTPPQESAHHGLPHDFPHFPNDADWLATYGTQPQSLDLMDLGLEEHSPASATSYEQYPPYQNGSAFITDDDIYAAHVQIVTQQMPTPEPFYEEKMMPQQLPLYPQHQQCMIAPVDNLPVEGQTQFSPTGQQNAVLYTPTSLREADEGFDDCYASDGSDFQLYPSEVVKAQFNPLFGDFPTMEAPSANLGFSQAYQDLFQQMGFYGVENHGLYE